MELISFLAKTAVPLKYHRWVHQLELTEKNGIALSEIEIYEHMASKNSRPSKKELIPSMLRVLGFEERDGKLFLSSSKDVEAPAERADA